MHCDRWLLLFWSWIDPTFKGHVWRDPAGKKWVSVSPLRTYRPLNRVLCAVNNKGHVTVPVRFCHMFVNLLTLLCAHRGLVLFCNSLTCMCVTFSVFLTFQRAEVTWLYSTIIKPEGRCGRLCWKSRLLPGQWLSLRNSRFN